MPTYYIDYVGGDDSNNGTAKGTPWKRHPYMTGWAGSYTHAAGDRFIFKGGVTWPAACFPMTIGGSGAGGNPDYYGVDATWYSGGSWARPVWDREYVEAATNLLSFGTRSYLEFDNLELKRLNTSVIGIGLVNNGSSGGDYCTIKNCYIHGWRTTAATDDALGGVIGRTTSIPLTFTLDNTEVENSENIGIQRSGVCCRAVAIIQNGCKIHDNSSGVLFCVDFNGSQLYNISGDSFSSGYHENGIYLDPTTLGATIGYIRNSYLHDVGAGANMAYPNVRAGARVKMYNCVLYGTMSAQLAVEIDPYQYAGEGVGHFEAYNNTIYNYDNSKTVFHVVTRAGQPLGSLTLYNNHVINAASLTDALVGSNVNTYTNGTNLLQTAAQAAADGYVVGTLYAPTNGTAGTVGAGTDMSDVFTTDILGNTRDVAWDIGAYELFPVAPSALTATATGSSAIALSWTDNASDETGYVVERSLNGTTGWTTIATLAADTESYTDSGLLGSTAYHYRVKAYNAYGSSAYSDVATDTTDAAPSLIAGIAIGQNAMTFL